MGNRIGDNRRVAVDGCIGRHYVSFVVTISDVIGLGRGHRSRQRLRRVRRRGLDRRVGKGEHDRTFGVDRQRQGHISGRNRRRCLDIGRRRRERQRRVRQRQREGFGVSLAFGQDDRRGLGRYGRDGRLILNRRSDGLFLVQRIRDEAHRFAITNHRAKRTKLGMVSVLEAVPGIGPGKRKALLKHFGNSIDAIRKATVDELAAVPGINRKLAETIKETI